MNSLISGYSTTYSDYFEDPENKQLLKGFLRTPKQIDQDSELVSSMRVGNIQYNKRLFANLTPDEKQALYRVERANGYGNSPSVLRTPMVDNRNTVYEVLKSSDGFTIFTSLVEKAGFVDLYNSTTPITVIAVSDQNFAKTEAYILERLDAMSAKEYVGFNTLRGIFTTDTFKNTLGRLDIPTYSPSRARMYVNSALGSIKLGFRPLNNSVAPSVIANASILLNFSNIICAGGSVIHSVTYPVLPSIMS